MTQVLTSLNTLALEMNQRQCGTTNVFPDALSPQTFGLTVNEAENQTAEIGLSVMGGSSHHQLQSVDSRGERADLPELTQLEGNDFKFGAIDFHAEFITQTICFPSDSTHQVVNPPLSLSLSYCF